MISGPSGAGKSTLVQGLLSDPQYQLSISCTTRKKRPGELHGREYYFLSEAEFQEAIQQKKFLEHASYAGRYYGTLISEVERIIRTSHCLLDIDIQGAQSIRENTSLKHPKIFLFLEPPNENVLIERLSKRNNNQDFDLHQRLALLHQELQEKEKFDRVFRNVDQNQMIQEVQAYLQSRFLQLT